MREAWAVIAAHLHRHGAARSLSFRQRIPPAESIKPSTLKTEVAMPYLKIQTNLPHLKQAGRGLLKQASVLVARELEKPEAYVMIALEDNTPMVFASSDDPAAFLELRPIGLPAKKTGPLSQALGSLVSEHLGIPLDRIFVNFADVPP